MRPLRLLELAYNQPLLITEAGFWSIHRLIEAHVLDVEMRERSATSCGEKVELPSMTIENGLAQIPIGGAIGQKIGNLAKLAGAVDVADVLADIDEAESNPEVRNVLFDIDSPGGMAVGTPELANRVAGMAKPKYAFSNGSIASALFYVASSTDGIFLTPSASAGSIGTISAFLDQTKAYDQAGLKLQLIKAGKYKGMGFPGTSLTETHVELLQQRTNQINDAFKAHIRAHRPNVKEAAMEGQMFIGQSAVDAGLADGIVWDKASLIAMLFPPDAGDDDSVDSSLPPK